jgi:hypothetical protein
MPDHIMSEETTSTRVSLPTQALLVFMCGLSYFYAFKLNLHWFDWFEFSHGTNWVFIPSGLRLLFVLVLVRTGAIGIALSSIAINYNLGDSENHIFNIVTGLISGGAPYLARHVCIAWLKLDSHMRNLSARTLLHVSIVFALTNALLHQLWFFWNDRTANFITSTFAMASGDWFGTVLVLACASLIIKGYRLIPKPHI